MKRREAVKIIGKTAGGLLITGFVSSCKLINGPSDTNSRTNDEVEFMYMRTLPIIDPNGFYTDRMFVWSSQWAGTVFLSSIESDQLTGSIVLDYNSQVPYYAFLIETKVTKDYIGVARTIFARIKSQSNWIQLTNIEQNSQAGGEWVKFFLDKNGIRNQ